MTENRPDLILSTSHAFTGMKRILFQPFDIKKWFILGFSAWLAQLLEGGGSNFSFNSGSDSSGTGSTTTYEDANEFFNQWIQEHLGTIIIVAAIVLMIITAIFITLVWVRSRGKFMFLDNVIHNRCLVKAPWHEFRQQGNSLCKWTLGMTVVFLILILAIAGLSGWHIVEVIRHGVWTGINTLTVIGLGLVILAIFLVWAYIGTLLEHFVIPLMYRDRITATQAWKKFLPLHRKFPGWFILYALWFLLLSLGVAVVVLMIGFATCCIGLLILSIPYLGVVILLPTYVFFRLLGLHFLRQCGEAYSTILIDRPPNMS